MVPLSFPALDPSRGLALAACCYMSALIIGCVIVCAASSSAYAQRSQLPARAPAPPTSQAPPAPVQGGAELPDALLYRFPGWIGPRAWTYQPGPGVDVGSDKYGVPAMTERPLSVIRSRNQGGSWENGDFGSVTMTDVVMEMKQQENTCSPEEASQMRAQYRQCVQGVFDRYDTAHQTQWPLSEIWRPSVPSGWYQGSDLIEGTAGREQFMRWCMSGGQDQAMFDPEAKLWFARWARETAVQLGAWFQEGGQTAGEEERRSKCSRYADQIIDDRQTAFFELCEGQRRGGKGNPYGSIRYDHFGGCDAQMDQCKRIVEGCTVDWTEYHYYKRKEYTIPCAPIDAFRWEGRGILRDDWMGRDGDKALTKGGKAGRVYRTDNRGFIGTGGLLNLIGLGGKPMEVIVSNTVASRGGGIGSYFYFDLSSGTVGINSFDESRPLQEISLPSIYKEVDNRGDKYSHLDDLPGQRDKAHGYVLHLYFCERTFDETELQRIQNAWGAAPKNIEELPTPCNPDSEIAEVYGERPPGWTCGFDPNRPDAN